MGKLENGIYTHTEFKAMCDKNEVSIRELLRCVWYTELIREEENRNYIVRDCCDTIDFEDKEIKRLYESCEDKATGDIVEDDYKWFVVSRGRI